MSYYLLSLAQIVFALEHRDTQAPLTSRVIDHRHAPLNPTVVHHPAHAHHSHVGGKRRPVHGEYEGGRVEDAASHVNRRPKASNYRIEIMLLSVFEAVTPFNAVESALDSGTPCPVAALTSSTPAPPEGGCTGRQTARATCNGGAACGSARRTRAGASAGASSIPRFGEW